MKKMNFLILLVFAFCILFNTEFVGVGNEKNIYSTLDFVLLDYVNIDDYLWAYDYINVSDAWQMTTGSNYVTVGILDSGIDDHNSYILNNYDSAKSISFVTDSRFLANPCHDNLNHGTSVASIVASDCYYNDYYTNGFWYSVTKNVKCASLQVDCYNDVFENIYQINVVSEWIAAINYANNNGIKILNISSELVSPFEYTSPYVPSLQYLYNAISNYDGLIICSAGNSDIDIDSSLNTNFYYPSNFDLNNIISVGSINKYNNKSGFSNYGLTSVDIFAPGDGVFATDAEDNPVAVYGTSFSAPYVTGVAALLWSIDSSYTAAQIKNAILSNAVSAPDLQGKCVTGGYLDAWDSLFSMHTHHYNYTYYDDYLHYAVCQNDYCNHFEYQNHTWRYRGGANYFMLDSLDMIFNPNYVPGYYCSKCGAYSPDNPNLW